MSIDTDIAKLLEKAVNSYLRLEPETSDDIASLYGKTIAFDIVTFNKQLFFVPQQDGSLAVYADYQGAVDTTIKARAADFVRLASADEKVTVQAEISGDVRLGERFQHIFASIEFDGEELLAPWIGDALANEVGKGVRGLRGWFQQCSDGLSESTSQYLLTETRLAVGKNELQQFAAQVDELRDAIDRCEAKLQHRQSGE